MRLRPTSMRHFGTSDLADPSVRHSNTAIAKFKMRSIAGANQLFLGLLITTVLLAGCNSVRSTNPDVAAADSLVNAAVDTGLVPGAVLLITINGRLVHREAYGSGERYDFDGSEIAKPIPMTTEHVFDLASLTKSFSTSLALMKLVDDGLVNLEAPVKTYLPLFSGPAKDSVTVRHLLAHTSGLYQWKPVYYHAASSSEAYRYISELPLEGHVGSQRQYSDLGYMLLGYLVETVSGQPLDELVASAIFQPLQLQATGYNPTGNPRFRARGYAATSRGNPFERRMVADDDFGYVCQEDVEAFQGWRQYSLIGEVNDGNAFYANGGVAGHAGLFSTATDLSVLLRMLTNRGDVRGQQLISKGTIDAFLTKDSFGHGLGWFMSANSLPVDNLPEASFGHTGFTGTYAIAMPAVGVSIVLLTNRQHAGVDSTGRYPDISNLRRKVSELFVN